MEHSSQHLGRGSAGSAPVGDEEEPVRNYCPVKGGLAGPAGKVVSRENKDAGEEPDYGVSSLGGVINSASAAGHPGEDGSEVFSDSEDEFWSAADHKVLKLEDCSHRFSDCLAMSGQWLCCLLKVSSFLREACCSLRSEKGFNVLGSSYYSLAGFGFGGTWLALWFGSTCCCWMETSSPCDGFSCCFTAGFGIAYVEVVFSSWATFVLGLLLDMFGQLLWDYH
ncbi:hypothetical protein U1Q18_017888 [Sarracenia purpurea var. burkii]